MSSLFKGLSEFIASSPQSPPTQLRKNDIFPAYVVDVILDETSEYYNGPESLGAVRFKQLPNDTTKSENVTNKIAYPLDRANFVQPLAGEQIVCALLFDAEARQRYFYITTVSTEQTAAAILSPFLGTDLAILKSDGWATPSAAEKRFDAKNGYGIEFLKARVSQEKLREGDKVLEGKFGGVIKFTHTIGKTGIWDAQDQITNLPTLSNLFGTTTTSDGDPMLIIKSALRSNKFEFEDDDINVDESSMYLTTTQTIPLEISCAQLKSFEVEPEGISLSALNDEDAANLSNIFGGGFDPNATIIKPENVTLTGTPQVQLVQGGGGTFVGGATGENGKLPNEALKPIGIGNHRLAIEAADAWIRMAAAAQADGVTPALTDSYRTFEVQNEIFDWDLYVATGGSLSDTTPTANAKKAKKGSNGDTAAAFPGTSNHGLGVAVDTEGKKFQAWLRANGVRFGWSWKEGRRVNEAWHFTYLPGETETWTSYRPDGKYGGQALPVWPNDFT